MSRAGAGRESQTCIGRPDSSAVIFPAADHEQDWQPDPFDPYLAIHNSAIYVLI